MCDLALLLGCYQINGEWQTDVVPAHALTRLRIYLDILVLVRRALVPHAEALTYLITNRTVEFLLVHEQMIRGSDRGAWYQMTDNLTCIGHSHTMILFRLIITCEYFRIVEGKGGLL